MTLRINLRRAYENPSAEDGQRILVDRVWPRGRKREDLDLVDWIPDIAPSTGLRKWFGHRLSRWEQFKSCYRAELEDNEQAVKRLLSHAGDAECVTLVFGAKDPDHNNAVVLADYLKGRYD